MQGSRYPTHDEVRGLLERLDEICREAERICTEVEASLQRTPGAARMPRWEEADRDDRHRRR
jgi:hypothetical protein